eukprot:INCI15965.1.p1 GENE.INCI15965.1~~INCI15965.1.p1  ORF type:complete len:290 (+),score=60.13 INCI15965.1:168-1037(+)
MLRVSKAELTFTKQGVAEDIRADGRRCIDFRDINIETGLLQQANGSSRVTFSTCDEGTAVVAAVKAEIVSLEAATSDAASRPGATDAVQTSASITAAALANLSKDQRNTMETTIAAVIKRTLLTSGALNLENLTIIPDRYQWVIFVDINVLQNCGNLVDAAVLAAAAAIQDARIPQLDIFEVAGDTFDFEVEHEKPSQLLTKLIGSDLPVCATVHRIDDCEVFDLTLHEEACSSTCLAIATTQDGSVCSTSTLFGTSLPKEALLKMLQSGARKCADLHAVLSSSLADTN